MKNIIGKIWFHPEEIFWVRLQKKYGTNHLRDTMADLFTRDRLGPEDFGCSILSFREVFMFLFPRAGAQ